ncbi:MAG: GNAT family N-acetyltransferase [Inquilinus sp.]|nr:GNAT family N-acetyltransferase [Inquilinus sp.]
MIRPFRDSDLSWALGLNAELEAELSPLSGERLLVLVERAFLARVIGPDRALLIAFDQDADYDSPNFLWFRARYPRFVYVDRIAVAAPARGSGLARTLYQDLFRAAGDAGHGEIVCEVNIDPPNPASDAFHASLGFAEVGRAELGNNKQVRYLRAAV